MRPLRLDVFQLPAPIHLKKRSQLRTFLDRPQSLLHRGAYMRISECIPLGTSPLSCAVRRTAHHGAAAPSSPKETGEPSALVQRREATLRARQMPLVVEDDDLPPSGAAPLWVAPHYSYWFYPF